MPGTCTREPVPYLFFTGAENVVIPMVKVPSGVLRRAQIAWRPAMPQPSVPLVVVSLGGLA